MRLSFALHRAPARRGPAWVLVGSALAACALGASLAPGLAGAEPTPGEGAVKRVLILQSFGSDFAPYNAFSSSFRLELARTLREPVDFQEVSVTAASSNDATMDDALVGYLVALGAARPPDLAVAIGGQAGRFALAHRERLFPATPLVLAGVDQRLVSAGSLAANDVAVFSDHDLPLLVESILEVLPRTETVAIVVGSSPLERFWRSELVREYERYAGRLRFLWWDQLAADEILLRAGELPPHSAILFTLFLVDGAGVSHADQAILRKLHEVANAPIFGIFDFQLGQGIVGGRLMPLRTAAQLSVEAAAAILRGERPAGGTPPVVTPGPPVYDARELERWGIRERSLPPGSTVLFRTPSVWEHYRWPLLGILGVVTVLAALVVALNINRIRLSHAERSIRNLTRRLLTGIEEERRRLGRELHDDVSQRLARLAIDASRVEGALQAAPEQAAELGSLRGEIVALSTDIHALSRWLHPSLLEDLGLVEALRAEADRFARLEPTAIELRLEEPDGALSQDAALCLYRIAQEALRNVARHATASTVAVSLRTTRGGCELEVRDDGLGFDSQSHSNRGLGLASMAERAQLVGGRLVVQSAPQRGTTVVAWVPANQGRQA